MTMKSLIAFFFIVGIIGSFASAQSLADAARATRAQKQRTASNKPVITNEALSSIGGSMTQATVSGSGADSASSPDSGKDKAADATKKDGDKDKDKDEATQKAEQRKQLNDDITKAKAEVEQLTRELDVLQRENRLRAASYYADAGNRLRNEAQYAADDRKYQADIQAKQQAITAAKAKLDDLQEQLRKLGSA
jgi:chromosome segregation ATPase